MVNSWLIHDNYMLKGKNMKKQYIKPQMKVVELEIHHMLAASPAGWNGEVGAPDLDFDDEEDV